MGHYALEPWAAVLVWQAAGTGGVQASAQQQTKLSFFPAPSLKNLSVVSWKRINVNTNFSTVFSS